MKVLDVRFNHAAVHNARRVLAAGQAFDKGLEALQAHVVQASQLKLWLGVVIDP